MLVTNQLQYLKQCDKIVFLQGVRAQATACSHCPVNDLQRLLAGWHTSEFHLHDMCAAQSMLSLHAAREQKVDIARASWCVAAPAVQGRIAAQGTLEEVQSDPGMVELLAEFNSTGEAADTRPGAQLVDDPALHPNGGSDADVDSEPPEVPPPPFYRHPHPQPRLQPDCAVCGSIQFRCTRADMLSPGLFLHSMLLYFLSPPLQATGFHRMKTYGSD